MDFNQRIDTIQVQKLVMTAKLRQSLAILNMTKTELEDEIKKQVEENPVMELDKKNKEINWEAYIKDIEKVKYTKINYNQKDDYNLENLIQTKKNLYEELKFQINLQKLNKKEKQICEYIIDSLDSDGYLRMDQNKICNQLNIEKEFFEDALNKVQQLEPSGVGARSLEECLIIQLKNQNQLDNKIEKIINESLNLIANNKIKEICKKYNISNVECADILNKIKNLEPKPGRYFELGENFYIEPDVILQKVEEEYVVFINENDECKIKINNFYKEILKNCKEDKDATQFIKEKLNQAVNLQNDIQNRKNTLLKICEEIIKIQYEFFERGSLYLKPLTMKQIANNLDCHESTISRGINGKYILTPRGMFELKYFFSTNIDKNSKSTKSIKKLLEDIINLENKTKPHSDEELCKILKEKNVEISRRTVAKYREDMGIMSSSKRKRYNIT